jgi:hypothetical protein
MRKLIIGVMTSAVLVFSGSAFAEKGTWTGTISDSACGASHAAMTEQGKKGTDKDCTEMCLKKGAKYVFVNSGKVYMIKNQNFADLKKFAGDKVTLNGDLTGDTMTITKLAAAK